MKNVRQSLVTDGKWLFLACICLSTGHLASARQPFRITSKMKEAEIIKRGMTEATDSVARMQYVRWYEATNPAWQTADSAGLKEAEAWFDNNCDETKISDYGRRTRAAKERYEALIDRYLRTHAGEYPAAAIVARRLLDDFKYTARDYDDYAALVADNPDTVHVNFISRHIGQAKRYTLGSPYADFEGMCPDRTSVLFSSLVQSGKCTLIDFWASWCGPCCAAIPKIKEMYEYNSGKLQVVSVSVDEKEAAWKSAIRKENMPWPQLWLKQDETATEAYAVNTIPRLVLVDAKGKIVLVTNDVNLIREKLDSL